MTAVTVFVLCLILASCGGTDQSTPKQTVKSARTAVEEHEWNRLYDLIHPRFRAEQIPRWRNHLINLLKQNDSSTAVGPKDVKAFTGRQIFRTYLESLSRSPRFGRLLDQYESADFSIKRVDSSKARVSISSGFPIPFRTVILKKDASQWTIAELEH